MRLSAGQKKTMGPLPGLVIFADVIVGSLHISDSSLVIKSVKKTYKEHENIIFFLKGEQPSRLRL